MRIFSISILCLCLTVSCGRSSNKTLSLAFNKMQAFQESEDVKYLSEAHDLFRQCEDGKSGEKMIPYRITLYEVFADYDGARNYISKIEGSHHAAQFDPVSLRTELEVYESCDKNEPNQVDSLLHQLIRRYAQLYKETDDNYWLQLMVATLNECSDGSLELEKEFLPAAFNNPESFDMDRFLQFADQSALSFEESYQDVLRIRNELNGFKADCLNPRLMHAILESIDENKKSGYYHYPDSVLCAGVWFDFRGDVDSVYVLGGPMPMYEEEFASPEVNFIGYYEGKNCLISVASLGMQDDQTVEKLVETAHLSKDKDAYKTATDKFTAPLGGMNVCKFLASSYTIGPKGTLFPGKTKTNVI